MLATRAEVFPGVETHVEFERAGAAAVDALVEKKVLTIFVPDNIHERSHAVVDGPEVGIPPSPRLEAVP